MYKIATLALAAIVALPVWKVHSLNASVDYLRTGQDAVPFFAYYRYGVMTDSVVFNVNTRSCATVVNDIIPSFRQFVDVMRHQNPSEIRLAWHGETVAVLHRSAMETIWQETTWNSSYALDPLVRAVRCGSDDQLVIDWMSLTPDVSEMT